VRPRNRRIAAYAAVALGAALLLWATFALSPSEDEVAAAGDAYASGAELDTMVTLASVHARLSSCASDSCAAGVVYVWSPGMPLSRLGIPEVASAARSLGLTLDVVPSSELYPGPDAAPGVRELAASLVTAGATLHAPALVVHRGGRLDRSAILGYKVAAAYGSLIEERLRGDFGQAAALTAADVGATEAQGVGEAPARAEEPATAAAFKDFEVAGAPGPYFRWVKGHNALAYEAGGQIYLLDLATGERFGGPGYVDFVPTPDGRFFVTPGRSRALEFYDAAQVVTEARAGRGRAVRPFYTDPDMQDQYPSVGILSSVTRGGETRTVYRILTSWFDAVVFRDYEVVTSAGRHTVRPIADAVVACRNYGFSIPILAPSGREVAGRDEATSTTKVFRLTEDGGCQEVVNLRLPTGKVAWDPDSERLAFAIPEGAVRDGSRVLWTGNSDRDRAGIFLFDRQGASVTRVEASMDARRLTFPEFVGEDQVAFLLPQERGGSSRFRLVCCLR
jgi:hypothetical protein